MINNWIEGEDYPSWMVEEGLKTLERQHLLDSETPKKMYERISKTLALQLSNMLQQSSKWSVEEIVDYVADVEKKWFEYMWNGWLCPSTPILANCGSNRGFTISCYINRVPDSIDGIYKKIHETAMLTKMGGGVGMTFDKVRGRGEPISSGGFTEGTIPFIKVNDSAIVATAQGNVRRGAISINLPVRHKDIKEFLKIRLPIGDVNRQCLNVNHCVTIDDYFYESLMSGDQLSREIWAEILSTRMKTGQPYIFNYHNANKNKPDDFKKRNLKIDGTNICCLSGNTDVITQSGIFKIKDLVGQNVTIFDGTDWVDCDSFNQYDESEIYRITLKNSQIIECTHNHRHFAAKNYNAIRKNSYYEKITTELKVGDFLESRDYEYFGDVNCNGAYLKGFLVGDGTSHDGRVLLNVHSTKYSCCDTLIKSAFELPKKPHMNTTTIKNLSFSEEKINKSYDGVYGKSQFKTMRGLTCLDSDLIRYVTNFRYSFPEDAYNWNYNSKIEFLSGLLDSDGTYNNTGGLSISSINKDFIYGLQLFIKTIGYDSNIDVTTKRTSKWLYRITINSSDSYELFSKLNCKRIRIPPEHKKPNRKTTGWRKIVKIEKLSHKEPVYCPQLPTTGKFLLANGILTGNTEIMAPHDFEHTVVCDLASLNLAKWDEFKDNPDIIELSLLFLDCNLELYINAAHDKIGFGCAVNFAKKARLLGLGVLGWHTLLQSKMIPFNSLSTRGYIKKITSKLQIDGLNYNEKWGNILGNPEWCDLNRNTTLFAIAPTTTNSLVSGGVSQGIEPIVSNAWIQKSAKGTFIRKNKYFQRLIQRKYKEFDTDELWNEIMVKYQGSVQHLDFLSDDEKEVFLTAYEINQLELVKNAALWQHVIDQGISLNLFFPADVDPKWFNKVHLTAWEEGLKSLYYVRTESILSKSMKSSTFSDCLYCEG